MKLVLQKKPAYHLNSGATDMFAASEGTSEVFITGFKTVAELPLTEIEFQ